MFQRLESGFPFGIARGAARNRPYGDASPAPPGWRVLISSEDPVVPLRSTTGYLLRPLRGHGFDPPRFRRHHRGSPGIPPTKLRVPPCPLWWIPPSHQSTGASHPTCSAVGEWCQSAIRDPFRVGQARGLLFGSYEIM